MFYFAFGSSLGEISWKKILKHEKEKLPDLRKHDLLRFFFRWSISLGVDLEIVTYSVEWNLSNKQFKEPYFISLIYPINNSVSKMIKLKIVVPFKKPEMPFCHATLLILELALLGLWYIKLNGGNQLNQLKKFLSKSLI